MEEKLWSKSLKERIEAEKYFTNSKLNEIKLSRLHKYGLNEAALPAGNHLRLNAFWLFIGVGNSSSEQWNALPRMDLTLGVPHLFERISENDIRISKAIYHQQLRSLLKIPMEQGFVKDRLPNCLSYQYVGNINISSIVAKNEKESILGETQKDDLKKNNKILVINKLIQASSPAFVVTNPSVFKKLKSHYKLTLVSQMNFKKLTGEIYVAKTNLPQTIFIRLPHHLSRCGDWVGTKALILEAISIAMLNGWQGINVSIE